MPQRRDAKQVIRAGVRRRLGRLTASDRAEATAKVRSRLVQVDQFREAESVGLYSAIDWEIDLVPLLEAGGASGKSYALPRWCAESEQYQFVVVESSSQLERGRYGILEPDENCLPIDQGSLDFVVIPGLAFSRNGARLGRGRGFYDRLLENCQAHLCGVCYEFQVFDELPQDPWDRAMNRLVTPRQCVETFLE